MTTFQELAATYLRQLQEAPNKEAEAHRIVEEIERLVYSDTSQPLNVSDKQLIVENIKTTSVRADNNDEYLKLRESLFILN